MLNQANIIGNLGKDPEFRTTQNGTAVCNISVATNHGKGDDKRTEWHRCVLWKQAAEFARDFCKQGSTVFVQGELQTRKWTDQSGQERYSTEINVIGFNSQFRLIAGGKSKEETAAAAAPDESPLFDEEL